MKLERLRDLLNLIQVLLGVASVAIAGGLNLYWLIVAIGLGTYAYSQPRTGRPITPEKAKSTGRRWTLIILIALAASLTRAITQVMILDTSIDFVVLLVVHRLFNRNGSREHMLQLLLGAVLMILGAVINSDLNYPILLVAYLPVATMTLIVNQLLSDAERLGARVSYDLRRSSQRHERQLWRASAQVALIAGGLGIVVFLVFPRFGAGMFFSATNKASLKSGFANEVRLGEFGTIKNDATVVMRLTPKSLGPSLTRDNDRIEVYLRGSSFDHYDEGRWTHSKQAHLSPVMRLHKYFVFSTRRLPDATLPKSSTVLPLVPRAIPGFEDSQHAIHMEVMLEDIGTEHVFAAGYPLGASIHSSGFRRYSYERLRGGVDRQMFLQNRQPGVVKYEFVSRLAQPTPEELSAVGDPLNDNYQAYLQRTKALSDRTTDLAKSLTAKSTNRFEKVQAVLDHLHDFEYSTTLSAPSEEFAHLDPVEGFLFGTQTGHCEYFATAMALILREAGVPSRVVNGYLSGTWNPVGEFYAVRQANAHSWVEVQFGGLGWIRFDPTPPSGRYAGNDAVWWPGLSQVTEAVRDAYLKYVIDYGLREQLSALKKMGVRGENRRVRWRALAAWLASPIFVFVIWRLYRRWRPSQRDLPVTKIYRKALRRLAKCGYNRSPNESARSFSKRVYKEHGDVVPSLIRFCVEYEKIRFGPHSPDAKSYTDAVVRLSSLAREVESQLTDAKARKSS